MGPQQPFRRRKPIGAQRMRRLDEHGIVHRSRDRCELELLRLLVGSLDSQFARPPSERLSVRRNLSSVGVGNAAHTPIIPVYRQSCKPKSCPVPTPQVGLLR